MRYAGALAILAILVLHAQTKLLPQMLWACHVASVVIAIGLIFDRPKAIAAGMLFHLGQGIPAYVLEVINTGENSPTSVLAHAIPTGLGLWALWRAELPRGTLLWAWLIHPFAMVISYLLTPPSLNINLVHEPWPPLAGVFTQLWMSWVANAAMSLVCLMIAWRLLLLAWRLRAR